MPHFAGECLQERRVDFAQYRKDKMSQFIPLVFGFSIGTVLPERDTVLLDISLDLGSGDSEKRSYEPCVSGISRHWDLAGLRHSAEPVDAGPAKKVQQQGFGVVIGVMGNCQSAAAFGFADLGEPSVPQIAGGHLDADPIVAGI